MHSGFNLFFTIIQYNSLYLKVLSPMSEFYYKKGWLKYLNLFFFDFECNYYYKNIT